MQSFWEKDQLSYFDFSIVGGGILGLFTAIELSTKFPKASIAIFDKAMFSMGATTRNAGFACFGSATEIWADRHNLGEQKTLEIIEKRWEGMKKIVQLFPSDIDYENYGGYELIMNREFDDNFLSEINHFLNPIFKQKTFEFSNHLIAKFQFGTEVNQLLYNRLEGQIHSGKLIYQLHKLAQTKGIFFFSNSEITDYTSQKDSISFQINHNLSIQTRHLIFCTNAFLPKGVQSVNPARGQVLITKPIENLPFKGTFHFDEGFYYFRNVGNRILFGGGRNLDTLTETTYLFELNNHIQTDLIHKLNTIISPQKQVEVDMQWSGIMAFSENKLPVIETLSDHIVYAMNCNGMGVSLSPVMAEEIVKLIS